MGAGPYCRNVVARTQPFDIAVPCPLLQLALAERGRTVGVDRTDEKKLQLKAAVAQQLRGADEHLDTLVTEHPGDHGDDDPALRLRRWLEPVDIDGRAAYDRDLVGADDAARDEMIA